MQFGIGPGAEHPGAVQHHIHPSARQGPRRILLGEQGDEILPTSMLLPASCTGYRKRPWLVSRNG